MTGVVRRLLAGVVSALMALTMMAVLSPAAQATAPDSAAPRTVDPSAAHDLGLRLLVFSKTTGFRHGSIPAGIEAIKQLGAEHGIEVVATEDAGAFTPSNLATFDAVTFLSTTGDVLNPEQQSAFEEYIRGGGGFVGVHAASDTEYEWPWYGELVGSYFAGHPAQQDAKVVVTDRVHPSTDELPLEWNRFDEWYNFQGNPRGDVHVLASLDESSYSPGTGAMGPDHPISWCQKYDGGRSWYTGMGHTEESYSDPLFRGHLLGGIEAVTGAADADCGATVESSFDQVTLAKGEDSTGEPMGLAVLPDGGVLHTARDGRVFYTAEAGRTTLAAQVPVYDFREDGMQGIALDPDFATNRYVYLFYSPRLDTPPGEVPHNSDDPSVWDAYKGHNNLSRFTFTDGTLDLASEKVLLQVPQDRGNCCHHGGDIDFDADGNLYLSTGDDTDPFESNGYSPIDDRVTRAPQFDARRTSGNTNDLRGKILRIHPEDDGTYTVPEGNLFAPGTAQTRPEVYAMGFRNPFRIDVDPQTGVVWVGDYGPDSGSANRYGPAGQVEFARVDAPGNYGWPFCTGKNTVGEMYVDRTFTSSYTAGDPNDGMDDPIGAKFDCAAGPRNDSRLNTGLEVLPPAEPAWINYDGGSVPEFGSGSESPMAGPVYRYDESNPSETKFPEYFDGQFFAYEFGRKWIKNISVNDAGEPVKIDPFSDAVTNTQLIDLEFGPDGSLYILDYGTGFFRGDQNSAVYRVDYVEGARSPVAVAKADKTSGLAPLTVNFDGSESHDPDNEAIEYAWDLDGDGVTDSTEVSPSWTYETNGEYVARLTVTDASGKTGVSTVSILVGNAAPQIEFVTPGNGAVFGFGDEIPYEVSVTDPDGTPVDCDKVEVTYALGHDQHSHGGEGTVTGCEGVVPTGADASHGTDDDIYGLLVATYTDVPPTEDAPPVTGRGEVILQPKHRQAEHFAESNGVQVVQHGGAEGGARVGYIEAGDWVKFEPYDLAGIEAVSLRVSATGDSGVELRKGAPDGPLVATVPVPNTGGVDSYRQLPPVPVTDPGGSGPLYLVFTGPSMDLDSFDFIGTGAGTPVCDDPNAPVDPDDPFDGDELDRCRWDTILREDKTHYRVGDGALQIDAQPGDMFGGNTDASNVVLQDTPDGGWMATTQLSLSSTDDYVQAGLIAHATDADFAKAVLINIPGQGWRFEFGQNVAGEPVFDEAQDRSGVLPEGINENAWLRIVSDGNALKAMWSADGETWNALGRTRSLGAMPNPKIGLAAYNGAGETASFESFAVDGYDAPACEPTPTEQGYQSLFDGSEESLAGWTMAGPGGFDHVECELLSRGGLGLFWHEEPLESSYSLKMDWKMAGDDNSGVFVGFPDPGTDPWVAVNQGHEVQIDATDDADSTTGAIYNFAAPDAEARDAALNPPGEWNEYEILVEGDRIRVYLNGALVNDYTDTDPERMNSPSFIGIQNHGNGDDVYFRDIRVKEMGTGEPDTVAPTTDANTDPTEPDGKGKWYVSPVTVTLAATDDQPGAVTTEYRVNGGTWTMYDAPLRVTEDGKHLVEFRSTDAAGNVETVRSLRVWIDAGKPTLDLAGIADGGSYGDSGTRRLTWNASDAISGVQTVTATLDGEPVEQGQVKLWLLDLGRHVLDTVVTDQAGNTTRLSLSFRTDTSFDDLGRLTRMFADNGQVGPRTERQLLRRLANAERWADDKPRSATRQLDGFRRTVRDRVAPGPAREVMLRDASTLIGDLR